MSFKNWLLEWEGFTFPGGKSQYVNPKYLNSKWEGPKEKEDQSKEEPFPLNKPQKLFGFSNNDPILKMQKK